MLVPGTIKLLVEQKITPLSNEITYLAIAVFSEVNAPRLPLDEENMFTDGFVDTQLIL